MLRRAGLVAAFALAIASLAPVSAGAVPCADVAPYPGDDAPKAAIAQWMAYGASVASMPGELPVMGALVASGLANLRGGDGDAVGFFQMRVGIWNRGKYAGYPDNPPLQLKWFIDQAAQVRQARITAGQPDPALDADGWGTWIADVLRPPEQRRYQYQLRLDEARSLIGPPCTPAGPGEPQPPSPKPPPAAVADTNAPLIQLSGASRQRALRERAIVLAVRCPEEQCTTSATAALFLPQARRVLTIALRPRAIAAGRTRTLRFVLAREAQERLRAALRSRPSVRVAVRVVATDLARNSNTRSRTVRLTR